MKITDIKVYPTWVGVRNQNIVVVETDAGITGLGEAGIASREYAVVGAVRHYREWLIGKDPMRTGALWQEMYRSQYFEGGRVLTAAQSAIDLALYDIKGKALGVPVYQLLGGAHRERIQGFASFRARTHDEAVEGAKLLVERGWNVMRVLVPQPLYETETTFDPRTSIGEMAARLCEIRQEIGNAPVVGLDYHHRLSVAETASFCQRMPSGTLDFLEEPIRDETPEAYTELRKLTDVPLAIGEEFSSKWQFLPYIERGLSQFCRVDVCNVGGFTEAMKVAGWAEAHYVNLAPHNPLGPICTAATLHLCAAVPNFAFQEVRVSPTEPGLRYDHELYPEQHEMVGDCYPLPEAPGLGVTFNVELAKEKAFKHWEAPHLEKPDGSHTNW